MAEILELVSGLKGSLVVFMVGPSTHVDPRREAGFAVFPHPPQTQLLVDSRPEHQGRDFFLLLSSATQK